MVRNRILLVGAVVCGAAGFSACATIPPQEVHAAAGMLRTTVIDSTPRDEVPTRFAVGGSLSRGVGNGDIGRPRDSTDLSADLELRVVDRLAFGLQPYLSVVDGNYTSQTHFGSVLYARWRFLDAGRWAFSIVPGIGYGRNSSEDQGQSCGIFGCIDSGSVSQSRVEIIDPRVGLITSFYFDPHNVVSLVPTVYYTHSSGSYTIADVPQFSDSRTAVEYSGMLAYGHVIELDDSTAMFQFSAGASTHRGFGSYSSGQHIAPLVQIGLQFSLGSDVD